MAGSKIGKATGFSEADRTALLDSVQFNLAPAGKEGCDAFLKVQSGSMVGRLFRLEKARTVVGRSDTNEIVLREEGVSRRHATIERVAAGFVLHDGEPSEDGRFKPSTNGVYVNGERITERILCDDDRIQLGSSDAVLKFQFLDEIDAQAAEELFRKATRDGLTGAYKKEYFAEQLRIDFSFATRRRQPLSLVLLDIVYFKKLNDSHGHSAGDHALTALAAVVAEELRTEDVFARWGGEEFAVLLRDTDEPSAVRMAERIRRAVEAHEFIYEGTRLSITVSAGVATCEQREGASVVDSAHALFKMADDRLYNAKRSGRNRVASSRDA